MERTLAANMMPSAETPVSLDRSWRVGGPGGSQRITQARIGYKQQRARVAEETAHRARMTRGGGLAAGMQHKPDCAEPGGLLSFPRSTSVMCSPLRLVGPQLISRNPPTTRFYPSCGVWTGVFCL